MDSEFASVYSYLDKKLIHHVIKKRVMGAEFRAILDAGYEELKATGATKWLSDDRMSHSVRPKDEEWARTVWFPRVFQAGWKTWALLLPPIIVGQMNPKRFTDTYRSAGLNAQLFSDEEAAMKWLESQ